MKILVLGSGAREHAIVKALLRESTAHTVVCAPGNAGIAAEVAVAELNITEPNTVAEFALSGGFDLVVIGPEAPLVAGVADPLRERGVAVFGPSQAAAQLEGSKAFAKRIMTEAQVPTGEAINVTSVEEAASVLDRLGAPYVIKADGLAAGKGVLVTEDRGAALAHVEYWVRHGQVLIEEYLDGEEVSLFFFSDGHTVLPLQPAQDYKRIFDNDQGPNTGGMGAYSPLPWLPEGFVSEVTERVALPTIRQLASEDTPFIGLLYCGLIVTAQGVRVIEFNARFGDPETQVVLPLLKSDLSEYLFAAATGTLANLPAPAFRDEVGVGVVLASENYPGEPVTGRELVGLADAQQTAPANVQFVHAATQERDGTWFATGGRVLTVVAIAETFAAARDLAYRELQKVSLEGGHARTDIAAKVS